MNVDMRDGPACCDAIVEPDVESVRMVLFNQPFTDSLDQVPQSQLLVSRQLEERCYVLAWDDKRVVRRNWIAIVDGEFRFGENDQSVVDDAEWAFGWWRFHVVGSAGWYQLLRFALASVLDADVR